MRVQNNEEEETVVGVFGAAAAVKDAQVSSLHKQCNELGMLPRTVFGAYKNARARRNYSMTKKKKDSAQKAFVKIAKAIKHADSCFLSKKKRKQLTDMCLQHLEQPPQQQENPETASTLKEALAAGELVQLEELKTILSEAGLDVTGLKLTLLQRVHKANMMHRLKNPRAASILLEKHNILQSGVEAPAKNAPAEPEAPSEKTSAEAEASTEQAPEHMHCTFPSCQFKGRDDAPKLRKCSQCPLMLHHICSVTASCEDNAALCAACLDVHLLGPALAEAEAEAEAGAEAEAAEAEGREAGAGSQREAAGRWEVPVGRMEVGVGSR